jgi:hypothetical protein
MEQFAKCLVHQDPVVMVEALTPMVMAIAVQVEVDFMATEAML